MRKVLIVEDEATIRKGLSFLVDWSKLGCTVVGMCADGREGLEFIRGNRPEIILTDVRMPLLDGIQMLNEAKGLYPFESIIVSGYEDFQYAAEAIRLDVSAYILKPINREDLERAVEKALQRLKNSQALVQMKTPQPEPLLPVQYFRPLEQGQAQSFMDAAISFIAGSYMRNIQVSDLCEALGVSKTSLNQKFKQETGHTVNSFISRYRITKALELMNDGSLRIAEIAEAVGFHDYKYFFEIFRKYVGCSPTGFVNNVQK